LSIMRKYQRPGLYLAWSEAVSDDCWAKKSEEDPEPATEAFNAAFDALDTTINTALDHTTQQMVGLTVLGAHWKYSKDGEESVLLSAARPLVGFTAPLIINLPKLAPDVDLQGALTSLKEHAERYLDGERGQLELPLPGHKRKRSTPKAEADAPELGF